MILACDPGLTGAFATYGNAMGLSVYPIPTQKRQVSGKLRDVIDEMEVIAFLTLARDATDKLYLEKVGGMPGQSGPAAFNFGYGYGVIKIAALCAGMTVVEVPSGIWKTAMKAPRDKKASRNRASELLPAFAYLWPLAKDDGKAEAAMLALYAARQEQRP